MKSCLIHSFDEPGIETWTREMNGGPGELNSSGAHLGNYTLTGGLFPVTQAFKRALKTELFRRSYGSANYRPQQH